MGNAIQRNITTVNLPTGGSQTLATGGMQVNLSGELSLNGETADTNVLLGGTFLGSGATAATGPAVDGFRNQTSPGGSIFDGSIAGTFYLERQ